MRISIPVMAIVLGASAAQAMAASDDLTIVSKNTHNGKNAGNSTSYMTNDHVRMAAGSGNETIVDLKTGVMTTLDGNKKTYFTTTKQDIQQMNAKLQERMNSPEMKKGMEFMKKMSGAMAQSYEVKDTGTTRKVAGFSCEVWTITMAGMSTTQECLTTVVQYPIHAFDAYREFAQGMQSSMSAFGPGAKVAADLAEKRKNMKGFALASSSSIEVMGTKTSIQSEVLEVRHGSIPATAWDIPAGYTKIENPMLKALDRQSHAHPAG